MNIKLNNQQKGLIAEAKNKGYLTLDDFSKYYTSPISIQQNIKRFVVLGLLKETNSSGKFEYIGEK